MAALDASSTAERPPKSRSAPGGLNMPLRRRHTDGTAHERARKVSDADHLLQYRRWMRQEEKAQASRAAAAAGTAWQDSRAVGVGAAAMVAHVASGTSKRRQAYGLLAEDDVEEEEELEVELVLQIDPAEIPEAGSFARLQFESDLLVEMADALDIDVSQCQLDHLLNAAEEDGRRAKVEEARKEAEAAEAARQTREEYDRVAKENAAAAAALHAKAEAALPDFWPLLPTVAPERYDPLQAYRAAKMARNLVASLQLISGSQQAEQLELKLRARLQIGDQAEGQQTGGGKETDLTRRYRKLLAQRQREAQAVAATATEIVVGVAQKGEAQAAKPTGVDVLTNAALAVAAYGGASTGSARFGRRQGQPYSPPTTVALEPTRRAALPFRMKRKGGMPTVRVQRQQQQQQPSRGRRRQPVVRSGGSQQPQQPQQLMLSGMSALGVRLFWAA